MVFPEGLDAWEAIGVKPVSYDVRFTLHDAHDVVGVALQNDDDGFWVIPSDLIPFTGAPDEHQMFWDFLYQTHVGQKVDVWLLTTQNLPDRRIIVGLRTPEEVEHA